MATATTTTRSKELRAHRIVTSWSRAARVPCTLNLARNAQGCIMINGEITVSEDDLKAVVARAVAKTSCIIDLPCTGQPKIDEIGMYSVRQWKVGPKMLKLGPLGGPMGYIYEVPARAFGAAVDSLAA